MASRLMRGPVCTNCVYVGAQLGVANCLEWTFSYTLDDGNAPTITALDLLPLWLG